MTMAAILNLLKLVPIKDWLYGAAIAALLGAFGAYTLHERHVEHAKDMAVAAADLAKAEKKAAIDTKALQDKADKAQANYESEHSQLLAYLSANPVGPVRLCIPSTKAGSVPGTAGKDGRSNGTAPPAANILPVPAGDSGVLENASGRDIGPLLDALAAAADEVTAKAKEMQAR